MKLTVLVKVAPELIVVNGDPPVATSYQLIKLPDETADNEVVAPASKVFGVAVTDVGSDGKPITAIVFVMVEEQALIFEKV